MVDEFIYQFQSFAQYRGKLAQKSPHELELLKKCDGVWDLQGVLHYLQGLIDKSGIVRELASDGTCVSVSSQVDNQMLQRALDGTLSIVCKILLNTSACFVCAPIRCYRSGVCPCMQACINSVLQLRLHA